MDLDEESRVSSAYTTRLDRTLHDLQERVKEQELVLQELRSQNPHAPITHPSPTPSTQLTQILTLREAYTTLLTSTPNLPPPKSALPALLAHRQTTTCINETRTLLSSQTSTLTSTQKLLSNEQSSLSTAKAINSSLQTRISNLQQQIEHQTQKTPAQIAQDLILTFKNSKRTYDTSTAQLVRAFNTFIDDQLSTLLAAEELGGPIVGEKPDLTEEHLLSGFSAQGKVKTTRSGNANANAGNPDKRQRRIDEIWGPQRAESASEEWDERRAAAAEMRWLTEELLNGLLERDESGEDGYIVLERESACARFLVRSKVAQFHFRDARRLRLVDFEKDIE